MSNTASASATVSITIPEKVVLEAERDSGERVHIVTTRYEGEILRIVPGRTAKEFTVRPE